MASILSDVDCVTLCVIVSVEVLSVFATIEMLEITVLVWPFIMIIDLQLILKSLWLPYCLM